MIVSHKTEYALRAVFELAKRFGQGPAKIADIAQKQAIPARFLEVILSQLKQAGFLDSRRGSEGGYFLTRHPEQISVADVIRHTQGPSSVVHCGAVGPKRRCPLYENCVFLPMWNQVQQAMTRVFDGTTFGNLLAEESRLRPYVPAYSI
jgi:Rrf2 family protein